MNQADQIRSFLLSEIKRVGGDLGARVELKRDAESWFAAYRRWAETNRETPIADCIFLKLLARVEGMKKSRERRKENPSGHVIKNDTGSPVRDTFYTLSSGEIGREAKPSIALHALSTDAANPQDCVLDAIENLIRNVIANGGEAALRSRLARLLPPSRERRSGGVEEISMRGHVGAHRSHANGITHDERSV